MKKCQSSGQFAMGEHLWIWQRYQDMTGVPTINILVGAVHVVIGLYLQWANTFGSGNAAKTHDPRSILYKHMGRSSRCMWL